MNLADGFPDYKDSLMADIEKQIAACGFIGGAPVTKFEEAWADYCGVPYAVGCSNGTDAVTVALESFGIGGGHQVIVPANSFIATAEAVCSVGASPVFCDVEIATGLLDCDALERALAGNTGSIRAVIPVHLWGQMADMRRIRQIADHHHLVVIEDAAQAHGAKRNGLGPGQAGDAAAFSFYPGKNLGAWGDAGAVITRHPEAAEKARRLVNHGRAKGSKYIHDLVGHNHRLDSLQATVLLHKLRCLDTWNQTRRLIARRYSESLEDIEAIAPPMAAANSEPVWYVYTVLCEDRDQVRHRLAAEEISTGVYYPVPHHKQPAFAEQQTIYTLPNTDHLADRILALPLWPEMPLSAVDYVVEKLVGITRECRTKAAS